MILNPGWHHACIEGRKAMGRQPAARGVGGTQAHARARREERYDGRRWAGPADVFFLPQSHADGGETTSA
jgi:hypothetical protein